MAGAQVCVLSCNYSSVPHSKYAVQYIRIAYNSTSIRQITKLTSDITLYITRYKYTLQAGEYHNPKKAGALQASRQLAMGYHYDTAVNELLNSQAFMSFYTDQALPYYLFFLVSRCTYG